MNVNKSSQKNGYADLLQKTADEVQMVLLDKEIAAAELYDSKIVLLESTYIRFEDLLEVESQNLVSKTAECNSEKNWLTRKALSREVQALSERVTLIQALMQHARKKIRKLTVKAERYSVPKVHPKLVARHKFLLASIVEAEAGRLTADDMKLILKVKNL